MKIKTVLTNERVKRKELLGKPQLPPWPRVDEKQMRPREKGSLIDDESYENTYTIYDDALNDESNKNKYHE
jgi:hypothetical protein